MADVATERAYDGNLNILKEPTDDMPLLALAVRPMNNRRTSENDTGMVKVDSTFAQRPVTFVIVQL